MTKRIQLSFLMSCIFLSAGWVSCNKNDSPSTPYTKIIGKWKKVSEATDDNANGVLDQWEVHPLAAGKTGSIEFKKDSTGTEFNNLTQDLPFRWMLTGEMSLVISYATGDTFLYKIAAVNSAHLQLTTKSKFGLAAYYYDTQK